MVLRAIGFYKLVQQFESSRHILQSNSEKIKNRLKYKHDFHVPVEKRNRKKMDASSRGCLESIHFIHGKNSEANRNHLLS